MCQHSVAIQKRYYNVQRRDGSRSYSAGCGRADVAEGGSRGSQESKGEVKAQPAFNPKRANKLSCGIREVDSSSC